MNNKHVLVTEILHLSKAITKSIKYCVGTLRGTLKTLGFGSWELLLDLLAEGSHALYRQ